MTISSFKFLINSCNIHIKGKHCKDEKLHIDKCINFIENEFIILSKYIFKIK